jgi:hypothetical protein
VNNRPRTEMAIVGKVHITSHLFSAQNEAGISMDIL